jgi:2-polyprenyl-6-methoxyphenol hydroxylase-like FAD-dependent oxidoreductase
MTVLIAGAGIGGLTLALSLHQIGIRAQVFESVAEIQPLGVGINVLPHATRELTELGLDTRLAETAIATAELAYFSKHGKSVWSEPRGRLAGYNWPQYSVHRGRLQMLLLDAARERLRADAIRLGHHLAGWDTDSDGVTARFIDRSSGTALASASGALLVAADGIHSAARARLFPNEGPPVWDGAILWRGVTVAKPFLTGRTMAMIGHGRQKFVTYPIATDTPGDDTALINWIAELKFDAAYKWRREDWNRPGSFDDFLPAFRDWRFDWLDVPALIEACEHVYEYPMVDRDPLPAWTHGAMTLLGDAAHPMYPIGSNGASQAILDARTLTRAVQEHGLTEAALAAYEAERRPATAKIVAANRASGPDEVMDLVESRAPDGFDDIEAVASHAERAAIADKYKALAGFDKDMLNARPSIVAAM